MAQQQVQLRKLRDFGENINDTFQFIRQEFKPLLKSFFLIGGVFILTVGIINGIYQSQMGNIVDLLMGRRLERDAGISPISRIINPTYFLVIFSSLINLIAMRVTIASYLKVYDQKGSSPEFIEVWNEFKRYFLLILLYSLLLLILLIVGFILCIAPFVWLATVLAPFDLVVVIENESLGGAFNRCFTIIKENFWNSLLIYIIAYLIYSFSSGIISFFAALIAGVIAYFTTRDTHSTVGIATGILNIFSFSFYIIFYVSVGMQYFNLAERADGTGIRRRLENLGRSQGPEHASEEQY